VRPKNDLAGHRCGRLLVTDQFKRVRRGSKRGDRILYWHAQCDCGRSAWIRHASLTGETTKSCGCISKENPAHRTHGHTRNEPGGRKIMGATYVCWKSMHARCSNPKQRAYAYYGGRGISVCERWNSFENFLADMGERPNPHLSIDRVNNDGNYEPGNCRWATASEQARNKRPRQKRVSSHE
jgi:hypothetical protein